MKLKVETKINTVMSSDSETSLNTMGFLGCSSLLPAGMAK